VTALHRVHNRSRTKGLRTASSPSKYNFFYGEEDDKNSTTGFYTSFSLAKYIPLFPHRPESEELPQLLLAEVTLVGGALLCWRGSRHLRCDLVLRDLALVDLLLDAAPGQEAVDHDRLGLAVTPDAGHRLCKGEVV
jgi:hypothetical protein